MIPAHLLDLVRPISFHPTVMIEPDGGAEGVSTSFIASNPHRIEALFSDAHRSRRTTPVTKATSGRGSSWDDSDSETMHRSDDPLFNVEELNVVRTARRAGDTGEVGDHCTGHCCSSAAYELEEATCGTAADITLQNITPFID